VEHHPKGILEPPETSEKALSDCTVGYVAQDAFLSNIVRRRVGNTAIVRGTITTEYSTAMQYPKFLARRHLLRGISKRQMETRFKLRF
jgi:hypothetical protein